MSLALTAVSTVSGFALDSGAIWKTEASNHKVSVGSSFGNGLRRYGLWRTWASSGDEFVGGSCREKINTNAEVRSLFSSKRLWASETVWQKRNVSVARWCLSHPSLGSESQKIPHGNHKVSALEKLYWVRFLNYRESLADYSSSYPGDIEIPSWSSYGQPPKQASTLHFGTNYNTAPRGFSYGQTIYRPVILNWLHSHKCYEGYLLN